MADGYRVIGPTAGDGAIVLSELSSAAELPAGWGVTLEPGGYQLRRRDDTAAFGHSAGPQSWKRFLHPPRERLWSATRTAAGFEVSEDDGEPVRYAFLGVRPCDLRAIAIQDRVLGRPGSRYAQRRAAVFIIAVNCTEPGETCFCTSMGTGPGVDGASPYDLALTELADERGHRFVVDVGSPRGADILAHVLSEPAGDEVRQARSAVGAAAGRMGRQLEAEGLPDLMAASHRAARWDDVASRCLTCGNCTMACPTCFCTSIEEVTDLLRLQAARHVVRDGGARDALPGAHHPDRLRRHLPRLRPRLLRLLRPGGLAEPRRSGRTAAAARHDRGRRGPGAGHVQRRLSRPRLGPPREPGALSHGCRAAQACMPWSVSSRANASSAAPSRGASEPSRAGMIGGGGTARKAMSPS